jgi:hypothetical protein
MLDQQKLSHVDSTERELTQVEVILSNLKWKWAKLYRRRGIFLENCFSDIKYFLTTHGSYDFTPAVVNYHWLIRQQLTTAAHDTYSSQNPASGHSFITLSLSKNFNFHSLSKNFNIHSLSLKKLYQIIQIFLTLIHK